MTESIEDIFGKLGSKLEGKDKKYLDKIENQYHETKKKLIGTPDTIEALYRQKLEENKDLLTEISIIKEMMKIQSAQLERTAGDKRSSASKIGSRTRWYNEVAYALGEIYELCENKRLRNIDNFKEKIQKICEDNLDFCSECKKPEPHCTCKS
jgi:hypothetical protein